MGKHFTVNQMVAKESVKSRFDRPDQGISYTEFSYMLLQAYDFLRLHVDYGCDLQIGGSDQWGNITMGVDLVRKVCGDVVWGLTTPLVVKEDGTKLGKTETGNVWLSADRTSPFALYQFFVNTPDAMVGTYLRFFTFLSHEEIEALDAETAEHPGAPGRPAGAGRRGRRVSSTGRRKRLDCVEASEALFGEEIAALSEEMLAGRHRGRADHRDLPTGRRRRAVPRRRAGAQWSGQVAQGGAPDHRAGRRLRQQRAADRRRPGARVPTTSCTTATSSCARDRVRSTSCAPAPE